MFGKSIQQPIGQKRLTNVAVVRLKTHGMRFEIACYKNKVLSWRNGVEKDLDEVLQSHTVYSNVSKGILAKSKDLIKAFGTDDQEKICLEILNKGELQVAGKERESQLSSQFRDIATIVMEKTINPETGRPYTINMIERLMHEVHFAVDPVRSSKKQALELIRELQKQFPIKRALMKLRLVIPIDQEANMLQRLNEWNGSVESKEIAGQQLIIVCQIEPGCFRECDGLVRDYKGRLEILSAAVHESDGKNHVPENIDKLVGDLDVSESKRDSEHLGQKSCESASNIVASSVAKEQNGTQGNSNDNTGASEDRKQQKCTTCNAFVGNANEYRDHFKSDWHKHNLKRKTRQLPPLSAEECLVDTEVTETRKDLGDYSF
eukprot:TRINITY_DN1590_c0_g1_i1.p1 TRINITY_DN1590_c0_g1~~TRINITY_DN1590_c0_g1_i1.p1  ORF type:complete len:376 (+),score=83.66 TRINITY_DN1590_c0_g1_i1:299-1426(+)